MRFVFVAKRIRRIPRNDFALLKLLLAKTCCLQMQRGISSVFSTIDRLAMIIENINSNELESFLSTEKGFRSDQVWNGCVFHHYTPLYSPFVSTTITFHYFTMWREESLIRRRKPMIGSLMRLCERINTLKRNQE